MDRRKSLARIRVRGDGAADARRKPAEEENGFDPDPRQPTKTDLQQTLAGVKLRERSSSDGRECRGDYLGVQQSFPRIAKFLSKLGDGEILFADRVLRFTESGKMKRRVLVATGRAVYLVDPETESLKRRIALDAVGELVLSELDDNFMALIVREEHDCLLATARKTEIVRVLVEAARKSKDEQDLRVVLSNRFEYKASSVAVKEVHFEKVEGGVRTRILSKGSQ